MRDMTTEWVVVAGDVAIISREGGEFWLLQLDGHRDMLPFSRPMTGRGSRLSTAALLDGALALGFGGGEDDLKEHSASLPRYVFDLVGAYHNAKRTPGNYLEAARRFREINRPELASYLEVHAREEMGHDNLVLKDLRALGLPAERVVANLVNEGVRPLYELFDGLSSSDYPVGCIGYSYCFERTAALKQKSDVDALTALCPQGVDASRFLRTHSSLGSEVSHADDMIDFVAGLPAADRTEITKVAYEAAVTMADAIRRNGLMSDSLILQKIQAAAGQELHLCP